MQASKTSPPGPKPTWLGEVVIHAEDIRRPLGIPHRYPPETLRKVADFFKGSNALIGAKNRVAGLTLRATDQDWSNGSGPAVEGPLLPLVMAMTGRKEHVDDLTGKASRRCVPAAGEADRPVRPTTHSVSACLPSTTARASRSACSVPGSAV